jgi:hypothetical protein
MASFVDRVLGAARLDVKTYEEVEGDPTTMGQALTVVVGSAVSAAIGSYEAGSAGVFGALVGGVVGWFLWAGVTWLIGTKLLPEPQTSADFGQLLRTIGFSAAPGLLGFLRALPLLGWVIGFVLAVWQLAAMIVAVRQALDYKSTGRAVAVCVIGWVFYLLVAIGFAMMAGVGRAASGL